MIALDHIGIAVADLERTLRVLEDLIGRRPYKSETVEEDGIRTYFLRGGGAKLELLESLEPKSPVARFIAKRGPGLHHLAFEVDDLDATFRRLKDGGYEPIENTPRQGADGKRIFFVHPRKTAGVLIEFCRSERPVWQGGPDASGHEIREAGSEELPLLTCLTASSDHLSDLLIRELEQLFFIRAVSADGGLSSQTRAFSDAPAHASEHPATHLLAVGDASPVALDYAAKRESAVLSLTLLHPSITERVEHPTLPLLIISDDSARSGNDSEEVAFGRWRGRFPASRLAVLPFEDPMLTARLIEHHARSTSPKGP